MLYLGSDQHGSQLMVNLRGEDGSVILGRQVSMRWERVRALWRSALARVSSRAAGTIL
jgi:hypothetical protein